MLLFRIILLNICLYSIIILVPFGCIKDKLSLLSLQPDNAIFYLKIEHQDGDLVWHNDTVDVPVTKEGWQKRSALRLDSIRISDYATINYKQGDVLNYSRPVMYGVLSENGAFRTYVVNVVFTPETDNLIKEFRVEGQKGKAHFSHDTIYIDIPRKYYVANKLDLKLESIKIAKKASVYPEKGNISNYLAPLTYTIIAENDEMKKYVVVARPVGDTSQIVNSDFNHWYDKSVYSISRARTRQYRQLGKSESASDNLWASYNNGFPQVAYDNNFPLMRINGFRHHKYAIQLTTKALPPVIALGPNRGVIPGIIFTGSLEVNDKGVNTHLIEEKFKEFGAAVINFFNNQGSIEGFKNLGKTDKTLGPPNVQQFRAASIYGIPFEGLPVSFSFSYKYFPASGLKNVHNNNVAGRDMMDTYVILENRNLEGTIIKRLGLGWFRSGDMQNGWKNKNIPIKYAFGSAPEGIHDYEHFSRWGNILKDDVTHIVVVFTSSYRCVTEGIGAPESKLLISDFRLHY